MPEQFENPEGSKLEDETISGATTQQRIDPVAERAAKKSSHTEQKYENEHSIISHRESLRA